MRTVLLGAPGSGKGTQSVVLSEKYNIPQVSTGDLLRAAVSADSELGKKAKTAMDAGALVSDDIVIGLIKQRLAEDDANNGYILDGFPRNIAQAEALDSMLSELNQPLQGVVLLDVAFDELLQRLTGRRTCKDCGAIYNIHLSPAKVAGHCDACNGELFQRADDNEETIGNRLNVYQQQTAPLVDFYTKQNKLHSVAGVGDVNEITHVVSAVFDSL
ncbi:MAG: adenylate kinase [Methylophaga sp.]|nr:MAG: adenylate kinase [Methylophaga sp.]